MGAGATAPVSTTQWGREGRLRKFPRWGDVHTEVWVKASDACEEEEDPCPVHSGESRKRTKDR